MNGSTTDILTSAMALPEGDRLEIAARLLESVAPPGVLNADARGFVEEIQRRRESYLAGESTASPWEEVRGRIDARLKEIADERKS